MNIKGVKIESFSAAGEALVVFPVRYCVKIHLQTTDNEGPSCGQKSENILHVFHHTVDQD
jgi:hypothetical protein